MKTFIRMIIPLGLAAGSAFGASWTGKLIDSSCHDRNPTGAVTGDNQSKTGNGTIQDSTACNPTPTTSNFALRTNEGQVFQLDSVGNSKAMELFRKNPSSLTVKVSGTMDGQTLKVDSLDSNDANSTSPTR